MRKFILAVTMTIPLLATGTLAATAAPYGPSEVCHPNLLANEDCANNNGERSPVFFSDRIRDQNTSATTLGSTRSGRVGSNHEGSHGVSHGGSHGGGHGGGRR